MCFNSDFIRKRRWRESSGASDGCKVEFDGVALCAWRGSARDSELVSGARPDNLQAEHAHAHLPHSTRRGHVTRELNQRHSF